MAYNLPLHDSQISPVAPQSSLAEFGGLEAQADGQMAQAVQNSASLLGNIAVDQKRRYETNARISERNAHKTQAADILDTMSSSPNFDVTHPRFNTQVAEALAELDSKTLESHEGGPESRLLLKQQLSETSANVRREAFKMVHSAQLQQTHKNDQDNIVNFSNLAGDRPDELETFLESYVDTFDEYTHIDEQASINMIRQGGSQIITGAFDTHYARSFDEKSIAKMRNMLGDEKLTAYLDPKTFRVLKTKLITAEVQHEKLTKAAAAKGYLGAQAENPFKNEGTGLQALQQLSNRYADGSLSPQGNQLYEDLVKTFQSDQVVEDPAGGTMMIPGNVIPSVQKALESRGTTGLLRTSDPDLIHPDYRIGVAPLKVGEASVYSQVGKLAGPLGFGERTAEGMFILGAAQKKDLTNTKKRLETLQQLAVTGVNFSRRVLPEGYRKDMIKLFDVMPTLLNDPSTAEAKIADFDSTLSIYQDLSWQLANSPDQDPELRSAARMNNLTLRFVRSQLGAPNAKLVDVTSLEAVPGSLENMETQQAPKSSGGASQEGAAVVNNSPYRFVHSSQLGTVPVGETVVDETGVARRKLK